MDSYRIEILKLSRDELIKLVLDFKKRNNELHEKLESVKNYRANAFAQMETLNKNVDFEVEELRKEITKLKNKI